MSALQSVFGIAERADLELIGVAVASLDYSEAASHLERLHDPHLDLNEPALLTELAYKIAKVQARLFKAQKLEEIGGPTSGIAHEINTAIQFIGDNAQFLTEIAPDLASVQQAAVSLIDAAAVVPELAEPATIATSAADQADLTPADTESKEALAQFCEGVRRVAEMARAMKGLAHPGSQTKSPVDLNRAIANAVAMARNEWKFHSDVEFDLDEGLPLVPGLEGPLKQALLVIIVNAAQAVEDAVGDSGSKGMIAISTSQSGQNVLARITDTGCGIPEAIRDRVFDPFFTTKEVGGGSGQGLTICRTVIIGQHGGDVEFESEPGVGTTFTISLPLNLEDPK